MKLKIYGFTDNNLVYLEKQCIQINNTKNKEFKLLKRSVSCGFILWQLLFYCMLMILNIPHISYISECVLMMQLFLSNNNRDILLSSASKELENINQCNVPNKFY